MIKLPSHAGLNWMIKLDKQGRQDWSSRGIEWTDATLNPIAGCNHGCRWLMPDGNIAQCYAEVIAERMAKSAYPMGFASVYQHLDRLGALCKLQDSGYSWRVFLDSMSDLFAAQVPEGAVEEVLCAIRDNPRVQVQVLTKNAPGLQKHADLLHDVTNVWAGVSMPPSIMFGKTLSPHQQERYIHKALKVLGELRGPITWISFEPLSFDVAPLIDQYPNVLQWAVIGAASNGKRTYQPDPQHVRNLLNVLDRQGVPVFFKGNLEWSPWREEDPLGAPPRVNFLPQIENPEQMSLF